MTTPRIIIATPVDGRPENATVTHAYHTCVRRLERAGAIILSADLTFCQDLVKARSVAAYTALQREDWDWVLWWDEDVLVPDTAIVPRMLAIAEAHGYEFIGAPYPMKRSRVQFPYKPLHVESKVENECIEVEHMGFGFVLTSRKCLARMTEAFASEWFSAGPPTEPYRVVALFKQIHAQEMAVEIAGKPITIRELFGEDFSFCHRLRHIGGRVMMYVGPGAPLAHVGGHVYTGKREELGNVL